VYAGAYIFVPLIVAISVPEARVLFIVVAAGITVVSGNAPTSFAVYVGLLAAFAQAAISLLYKYPLKSISVVPIFSQAFPIYIYSS